MSEERREFGRDGVSGLVDRERALRARLLPRRADRCAEEQAAERRAAKAAPPKQDKRP